MSSTRQDAWTHDEDLLLAEIVLRHIREGGTQLQAFEKVGKKLARTAAACGFRWNSYLRKQYKSGIELAKKQRKERKVSPQKEKAGFIESEEAKHNHEVQIQKPEETYKLLKFEDLIGYLKVLYEKAEKSGLQTEDIKSYEERIQNLEKQLYYLAAENEKLIKNLNNIEKDYNALLEIMEKARKMAGMAEGIQQKV